MKLTKGIKLTFLVHFILSEIVGIQHLLAPRIWTDLAGIEVFETLTWRLVGAAVIAFGIGSLLCYKENRWERVRIVVIMEIVWSLIAALVIIWGLLFRGLANLEWLNALLLMIFAIVFFIWYYKMSRQ